MGSSGNGGKYRPEDRMGIGMTTYVLPDGTTTCCGAYTSIFMDDGTEYCKGCYQEVVEHLTEVPPERFRVEI